MRRQNIKQKRFSLSWPKAVGLGVVVLVLAAAVWFVWIRGDSPDTSLTSRLQDGSINYDPPTKAEKKEAERQKEAIIEEEEAPPTDQSLSITVVRTFQDPGGVNIRTIVGGTTSGQCHIELSKSGQSTIVKTFPVVFEATSATCQNTPIAVGEFAVGGTWDIRITVRKDAAQSVPTTTSIDVVK